MVAEETVGRLREALFAADYRYDAVAGLLGPVAHRALSRNETVPALQATRDGSPLATLTRLWLLQAPVDQSAADRALPGLVAALCDAGMLAGSAGEVTALVDVRPYATDDADLWLVSDLTPGLDGRDARMSADHVLGVSSASTSLAQLTVREPVGAALDLGTGCGVQAMHLSRHAGRVVATDVNRRALAMTRLNASLNDVDVDVREGSLFEPVAEDRFDLIVTNPPFVVSPATGDRLVYRDSGLPGDEVVRRVVTEAPRLLRPGGWCQVLANWVHVEGVPWQERLSGWLDDGCHAWVVQREVADPAEYVELWLKDAGLHGSPEYVARYDAWLSWFAEQRIEGIGFGWINLRRDPRAGRVDPETGPARDGSAAKSAPGEPGRRIEEWPYDVEQPLGAEVADWGRRTDALAALDDTALLGARLTLREDVRQETYGEPGAADPQEIVLRQQRGMRRARQVDTVQAGLVGACDGELAVGQILDALADLLDRDAADLRRDCLPVVRDLLADGFLETSLQ